MGIHALLRVDVRVAEKKEDEMARLASQVKLGYYPTPVEITEQIKKMLRIPKRARLLDPCCGEGDILHVVAEGTGSRTYGIELDRGRFLRARSFLDRVIWGDALYDVGISNKAFSLLWLNPPYDSDGFDSEGKRDRLEIQFLKKYWSKLQPGGVLVYIIPLDSAHYAGDFLSTRARELRILRFSDPYFADFRQVVILARKMRPKKGEITTNRDLFKVARGARFISRDLESLPTTDADLLYEVPGALIEDSSILFRSYRLDPDEALETIRKSPLWTRVRKLLFSSPETSAIRSLMPLREGHLAMLLASGMMNGEVVGDDGRRLIVKGSVRKVREASTEETEEQVRHISTDRYEITVRAICFDPLEIVTIS